jgi:hypothetical protein
MRGNGGNDGIRIISTEPSRETGEEGMMSESPVAAVSGLGMTQFVRSYINGSGEQLPEVAILRPGGRPLPLPVAPKSATKEEHEMVAKSAFVEMDVGVLNKEGNGYDVRNLKVPFECYNYTALDRKTYIKLMDYVCTDLDGRSLCDRYGSGRRMVKVFDV